MYQVPRAPVKPYGPPEEMTTPIDEDDIGLEEWEKRSHVHNAVESDDLTRGSYETCEKIFAAEILSSLGRFNGIVPEERGQAKLEKRQFLLGSLTFLAGLYTSNVVETIKERLVG